MRIRKPNQLELEYVQRMMAWLLWRDLDALEREAARCMPCSWASEPPR